MRFVQIGRRVINLDRAARPQDVVIRLEGEDAERFRRILESQCIPGWRPGPPTSEDAPQSAPDSDARPDDPGHGAADQGPH